MGNDPESRLNEPEEELPLPQGDDEGGTPRQRKPVSIPERTKPSGMVRRQVSVGDLKRGGPEPLEAEERQEGGPDPGDAPRRPTVAGAPEGRPIPKVSELVIRKVAHPESREGGESGAVAPPHKPVEVRNEFPAAPQEVRRDAPAEPQPVRLRRTREPEGEEAFTGSRSSLWFVLAGVFCVAVVGYFLSAYFKKATPLPTPELPRRLELGGSITEIPIAEFLEHQDELLPMVAEILERAEKSEGEELAKLLRGGAESVALMKKWRARGAVPARHRPATWRQLHAAAVGNTGYLVLAGLDADYLLASAYFVKVGDELKYDWEASEGYSDLLPSEVETLSDEEPKLMRVVVSESSFYTPQFPEEKYTCYSFHHQDPGVFVWGFARRGSLVDRSLRASYLAPDLKGSEGRATVKVRRGPEGARANQLEVVEFLHTDWLAP